MLSSMTTYFCVLSSALLIAVKIWRQRVHLRGDWVASAVLYLLCLHSCMFQAVTDSNFSLIPLICAGVFHAYSVLNLLGLAARLSFDSQTGAAIFRSEHETYEFMHTPHAVSITLISVGAVLGIGSFFMVMFTFLRRLLHLDIDFHVEIWARPIASAVNFLAMVLFVRKICPVPRSLSPWLKVRVR